VGYSQGLTGPAIVCKCSRDCPPYLFKQTEPDKERAQPVQSLTFALKVADPASGILRALGVIYRVSAELSLRHHL